MTWQEIQISHHTPDTFGQCPVCHQTFTQPVTGRRRVYCSDACKQKEFRNTEALRNSSPAERSELVKRHLSIGDWRCTTIPEWPHYRCLACGDPLGAGPAWYDWNDFYQVAGVYRRLICTQCSPPAASRRPVINS